MGACSGPSGPALAVHIYLAATSSAAARSVIPCSVRMVVSMSSAGNWLSRRAVGPDVLAQAAMQGLTLGRQVDLSVAVDQPLGLEPGEELPHGVGVECPRALELSAQRLAGNPARAWR